MESFYAARDLFQTVTSGGLEVKVALRVELDPAMKRRKLQCDEFIEQTSLSPQREDRSGILPNYAKEEAPGVLSAIRTLARNGVLGSLRIQKPKLV